MRKVFEPDEMELADLGGDTHFVTDIQRHVKNMLGERGEQRKEMRLGIQSLGPRALPGVLNATCVFAMQLKKRDRELLADLLAGLVGENQAAREMLLKIGVLELPFVPARRTAVLALEQLGSIYEKEMTQIRLRAWMDAYESEDYEAALALYEFLIHQGDSQACAEVRSHAERLFKSYVDIGPSFLNLALQGSPEDTYEILIEVMGSMDRKAKKFGQQIGKLVSHDAMSNLFEVLRATDQIREISRGYAHKGIEYLFTGPIVHYLEHHSSMVEETGDLIRQRYRSLHRYWWQALGRMLKVESVRQYFETRTVAPLDDFTQNGAIQLLFVQRDQKFDAKFVLWATDLLDRLKEDAPNQYQDLLWSFERFEKAPDGQDVAPGGSGRIKKRQ